jgi:hypothetical protein
MKGTGFLVLPKEKIDKRDYLFGSLKASGSVSTDIPSFVSHMDKCGPVMDQGSTNSCVGHAHASIMDMLWRMEMSSTRFFSPLFSYWIARDVRGWTDRDEGAYIYDAMKQFNVFGLSPEKLHPFSRGPFVKPNLWAYAFAKWFGPKPGTYYKITDANMDDSFVDDVKIALANSCGVEGGIRLFEEFWSSPKGVIKAPTLSVSKPMGAHAVHWVGYVDLDDVTYEKFCQGVPTFDEVMTAKSPTPTKKGYLIFKNSWGYLYGTMGYGMISYEYVDEYGNDFWAIKK